jgi:hypothetical protein
MRLLAIFCLLIGFHLSYSQEIPPDLLKKMEETSQNKVFRDSLNKDKVFTSKKGGLILTNGIYTDYTKLQIYGDSVSFLDSAKVRCKYPISDIYWLNEKRKQPGIGALIGLGGGLVTGVLAGSLAYPENSFIETLIQIIFTDDAPKISKKAIPLIAGFTLGGTAIGTLAGLLSEKEVLIIDKRVSFIVKPEIFPGYADQRGIMVRGTIRF